MKQLQWCEAGCGRRVKRRWRVKGTKTRFCSPACVPSSLRADNCRAGRATYAYRYRAKRYQAELQRIQGRRLTTEDLLAIFARIERHGYVSGFQAGSKRAKPAIAEYAA
jgi:hypothetical protein